MSARPWRPELEVDEAVVRDALASALPGLPVGDVVRIADGWDNSVWSVGDGLVVRIARRRIAIPGIEREIALLPRLARRLPLPIPAPVASGHVGRDGQAWPFFVARLLPGRELPEAGLPDADRAPIATAVGRFLRVLHEPALVREVADAGLERDPMGRADMAVRVPKARQALADAEAANLWSATPVVERLLDDATRLSVPGLADARVAHGDLHIRHVLVDDGRGASGVIDWGDLCLADPAVDLQLAWTAFAGPARVAFLEAYGVVPRQRRLRARVLGLFLAATLAVYARDARLPAVEREAVAALDRVVEDDP